MTIVDDVAIGTETVEQHMKVVVDIVATLAKRGFSVKAEKMKLVVEEFEFLGHLSTPTGLRVTDRTVEAISKMPLPDPNGEDPKTQVKSFLGMASYVRKFVPGFEKIATPLNQITEKGRKFVWTDECQEAWDTITRAIAEKKGNLPSRL